MAPNDVPILLTVNVMKLSRLVLVIIFIIGFSIALSLQRVQAQYIELDATADVWVVIDGDTFDAFPVGRVRLADIDAPERGEMGYDVSRSYLTTLIDEKQIYLDVDNNEMHDPTRRLICMVYVRKNTTHLWNVNQKLVVENYADVKDFTNNEFDPDTWTETVYYPIAELPERSYPQLLTDYLHVENSGMIIHYQILSAILLASSLILGIILIKQQTAR
jgi:endonuclease YncB( thermonuclease family)